MKQPFFFLFFVLHYLSYSQNLVLNPSFEEFYDCPRSISLFHNNVKNWSIPNNGTTDYYNSCSKKMGFDNFSGHQKARTGNGYAGFYAYFKKDYREYVQGKLASTLQRGKKYQVTYYISLGDYSKFALKELGLLMSQTKFSNSKNTTNINAIGIAKRVRTIKYRPTFSRTYFENIDGWMKVSFIYTAEGFENYFSIGNFNSNSATNKSKTKATKYEPFCYYYIDDVSIEPLEKDLIDKPTKRKKEDLGITINTIHKFNNVLFEFNEATLLDKSKKELNKLYNYLYMKPELHIEIYGHTDSIGQENHNKDLSEQRAKSVADYLISQGLSKSRIKYFGFGSSQPISDNTEELGRELNRRVEFKLIDH